MAISLSIIGGYLGAGKTTLLNHLLSHAQGRRIVVLVNDFGSINIDAKLIASQDDETIMLTNGCACCTIADDLSDSLMALCKSSNPPDHIVIEASGIAEPAKLARYCSALPQIQLDSITVVVDAETIAAQSRDKFVGYLVLEQLQSCDILVLNKMDLLSPVQGETVSQWVAQKAPSARLMTSQHGQVPINVLLGSTPSEPKQHFRPISSHGMPFWTFSYISQQPLRQLRFENLLANLPPSVVRAKGFLTYAKQPEQTLVLQLVGKRHSFTPFNSATQAKPDDAQTQLVFIGFGDTIESQLRAQLEDCEQAATNEH